MNIKGAMPESVQSPEKREPSCRTCKFWDFHSEKDKDKSGICRRHPPIPVTGREENDHKRELSFVTWPLTKPYDWCGEWIDDGEPEGT